MNHWSLPRLSGRWWAVWRRHLRVWSKLAGPAVLGNFGEPLLILLALGYGLGGFVGEVQGLPYLAFLASGVVCSSTMNTATFEGLYSAFTRLSSQQTWHAMLCTPLDVDDIVFGEAMWAATKGVMSGIAILIVMTPLGVIHDATALMALPILFLTGLCFASLALVITAFAHSYDFFLYYSTLAVTPMFLLSGIFFPLGEMGPAVQTGAWMLPLAHAVALIRPLVVGLPLTEVTLHLLVLAAYTLVGLYFSIVLLRRRLLGNAD
ncbi:Nodulation protein J [Gammaproteobacteria bacterium]